VFLGVIILLPTLIIILFGPFLFSVVLGEEWYEAGVYSQWLMLWLMFGFMNRPASATAQVLGLQKFIFYYEVLFFLSRLVVLILGAYYLSSLYTIVIYSIVGAIFNFSLIMTVIFLSKSRIEATENID
jgi:lipopolysaccharide exporter